MHVCVTDGNTPESDTFSPTDIEANLSTEVALTVLDVLGLFVHHHKVSTHSAARLMDRRGAGTEQPGLVNG